MPGLLVAGAQEANTIRSVARAHAVDSATGEYGGMRLPAPSSRTSPPVGVLVIGYKNEVRPRIQSPSLLGRRTETIEGRLGVTRERALA